MAGTSFGQEGLLAEYIDREEAPPTPVGQSGQAARLVVDGIGLEMFWGGLGAPLLVLHDYEYLNAWQPFEEKLADDYHVLVPSHPGFGTSELPQGFDAIEDYAYFYLDLLRKLGGTPVHLMGLGIGGWMAAELAVRCTHGLASLTLVDAVGIKVSDRNTRDIADTFVVGPEEILRLTWHDPAAGAQAMRLPGLGGLSESELVPLLRNRQTTSLFAWKPFMHNPKLARWLTRINVPTLVLWGESDRLVTPAYGQAYAQRIPGARFQTIPQAGHYPYLEQPEAFTAAVAEFLRR